MNDMNPVIFENHTIPSFSFVSTLPSSLPPSMASVAATQFLLHNALSRNHRSTRFFGLQSPTSRALVLRIRASQTSEGPRWRQKAPPGVDTRIHWDNEDEGWLGGSTSNSKQSKPEDVLGQNFADLISDFSGSHYEFLGVSAEADIEEIKAAYRRLSKEYHPDTTSLPLKTASDKFMKLREVYNVLSNEERRKFYDWTLLQEAASRQSEKMKMRLEDPREQELKNWESVPDMVDRLGGRNMKLSDQAATALTVDVFIIIFAICCIIYVIYFKEPYY